MLRRTKIVATMGPAEAGAETVTALVEAGMDVARLNFSHGDHASHTRMVGWLRQAAAEAGRSVAVLQDIQGPKTRVGSFAGGEVELGRGDTARLVAGGRDGGPGLIPVDYERLLEDVGEGARVVMADGLIEGRVTGVADDALEILVLRGGTLRDRKGVAFPDSDLRVGPVTEKDREDLELGRKLGVDYVAASFVKEGADVNQVRELAGPDVPVIAKVELALAYRNLDSILEAADGVMVARGDLGVQLPLETIPNVQADILRRTNRAGLITITATEMLESMVTSPRPTRAEVTDVANAVASGNRRRDAVRRDRDRSPSGPGRGSHVGDMSRGGAAPRHPRCRGRGCRVPRKLDELRLRHGQGGDRGCPRSRFPHHRRLHRIGRDRPPAVQVPPVGRHHGVRPQRPDTAEDGPLLGCETDPLRTEVFHRPDVRVCGEVPGEDRDLRAGGGGGDDRRCTSQQSGPNQSRQVARHRRAAEVARSPEYPPARFSGGRLQR